LFHWALALAVIGLVISGHVGGNALQWHMWVGEWVGALLVFRLIWGVVGGRWSRFSSFVRMPGTVLRYLRGEHREGDHFDVGHNPLGALSVLALMAMLMVQVATGLVADDEVATTGPLNKLVSNAAGLAATGWHTEAGQWVLIALAALHVAAIAVYRRRGVNLVVPMITGDKDLPAGVPASTDTWRTRAAAAVLFALCAAGALWLGKGGG
jgi:cytochrome b